MPMLFNDVNAEEMGKSIEVVKTAMARFSREVFAEQIR